MPSPTTTTTATALPPTMKAWQFTSTSPNLERNLKLNPSAPLPSTATALPADTVLVHVLAAALNPVDYKFAEIPLLGRLITGSPSTPGIDFAGRVVATGPNTRKVSSTDLKEGQLVYGRLDVPTKHGTLAEYTVAPRKGCVALPEGVNAIDAACAGSVALTAYQSIMPKIKGGGEGQRVFINGGSGGTGTFGIQIAKAAGCFVVTSCSTGNVELCRGLGADVVIDYKTQDVVAELTKMGKEKQGQFDLIVDNVGYEPANLYWASPAFLKPGKAYVQPGSAGVTFGFVFDMLYKSYWPSFLGGGQRPWEFLGLESKPEDLEQIGRWMQEGKVRAVVDEVFGMEDKGPVRAYEKLRLGRTRGKIVVKVAEE